MSGPSPFGGPVCASLIGPFNQGLLRIRRAIAAAQAQAVGERVGNGDDFAPRRSPNLVSARAPAAMERESAASAFLHNHIKVHPRPVAIVPPQARRRSHRPF